jgi:hypothetical protein
MALAALLAASVGCSPRVLVAVGPIPDAASDVVVFPPVLLDGLVGHWRLDDGAGSTTAQDSAGGGNHGTLRNLDPATDWVAGRSLGALNINARGWVAVASSDSINTITNRVTVAAWVYLTGSIVEPPDLPWATALSRQKFTGIDQHYHLALNRDARPNLYIITATMGATITAPTPVTRASWVHIAGTYDGSDARLYVDGVQAAAARVTGSFSPDTTPIILGGNGNNTTDVPNELFPGRLDELMLYRRALSADEIADLAAGLLFPAGARRDAGTQD